MSTSHLINNQWIEGIGQDFGSTSPSHGNTIWTGKEAVESEINAACEAARSAFQSWSLTNVESRIEIVLRFAALVKQHSSDLALLISQEMGKPNWESKTEAAAVVGKAQLAIDALRERRDTTKSELSGFDAVTRYKPHGVLGVLGPFNFAAHLPNGHIIPAILAGNTIVFKPSEQTPAVGQWLARKWIEANLPPGVINLVQGARTSGELLASHPQLDGLLFTGSSHAGRALHQLYGQWPNKMLALEMGGNNPLVVYKANDLQAAAFHTIMSAYITSGQRCTCARRLYIIEGDNNDQFIDELVKMITTISVGFYDDNPEPFMGTVISAAMGDRLVDSQQALIDGGAVPVVPMAQQRECKALVSPGLVDVSPVSKLSDEELFGPLLQVQRVPSFEKAIEQCNDTAYGLSAGLLSDDRDCYQHFITRIRAGIVNWNRQTTGASGKLPFGGCGLSGNNRPSGYFAADYCSFPTASLESPTLEMPENLPVGMGAK